MTGARTAWLVLALTLGCAGCASAAEVPEPGPAPSPVPPVVASCGGGSAWQPVPGAPVEAAQQGSGPTVVLANDSDNSVCPWSTFAATLAGQGHRVVVLAYGDTSASGEGQALDELLAVAARAAGPDPYALVGASLGGRLVLEAAARHPAGLTAVVSLSGEREVEDYRDILPDVRRVTTPLLYVGSTGDPLTDGPRQPRQLTAAARGRVRDLVLVDGTDHGTDLLLDTLPGGGTPTDRVGSFLAAHLR